MMGESSLLDELSKGFRGKFLTYDQLTEQLHAWARAFPDLARVESIGRSPEGRELWLLTVGRDPDRKRPAVWVDGNMHASELCGSSVALAIAEDALRAHLGNAPVHDLPAHVLEVVSEVLLYVLPRVSPDGAEAVLSTGKWVRSVPRDARTERRGARWIAEDANGDGLALLMRQKDPAGEFVESAATRGVMLPRCIEDAGPFYKLYPEGRIEGWDGHQIPDADFLSDNSPDLNRNFPWSWAPEHDQVGAGDFAASEPESRAIVEFATKAPHIFAWLNLHTFGGVLIRPCGHLPDAKMDQDDLAVFRQLEEWADRYVGYPTVSGYEQFTYEPEKPLHGDLSDFAYNQRGAIGYVCELWDLFEELGLPKKERFVERYLEIGREEIERLGRWDSEKNEGRLYPPWVEHTHPQIGEVEIGGYDPRIGIWNPPYDRIDEICRGQSAMFLRVAAMAPRLGLSGRATATSGDVSRVDVRVHNHGYLPTYGLSSAKKLVWNEPVWAEARVEGCSFVDDADAKREVGHLEGWGRGKYGAIGALQIPRSRGSVSSRSLAWHVRGRGRVTVVASCPRTGRAELTIDVP